MLQNMQKEIQLNNPLLVLKEAKPIPLSGLEKTGKPKYPSIKYKPTVAKLLILYPKLIPRNITTKVCIVIGTR